MTVCAENTWPGFIMLKLFLIVLCCKFSSSEKLNSTYGPKSPSFYTIDLSTSLKWDVDPSWKDKNPQYLVQTCVSECFLEYRWRNQTCRFDDLHNPENDLEAQCHLDNLSPSFSGEGRLFVFLNGANNISGGTCSCTSCGCFDPAYVNFYNAAIRSHFSEPIIKVVEALSESIKISLKLPSAKVACYYEDVVAYITATEMQDITTQSCSSSFKPSSNATSNSVNINFAVTGGNSCESQTYSQLKEIDALSPGKKYCVAASYDPYLKESEKAYLIVSTQPEDSTTNIIVVTLALVISLLIVSILLATLWTKLKHNCDFLYKEPNILQISLQNIDCQISSNQSLSNERERFDELPTSMDDLWQCFSPHDTCADEKNCNADDKRCADECADENVGEYVQRRNDVALASSSNLTDVTTSENSSSIVTSETSLLKSSTLGLEQVKEVNDPLINNNTCTMPSFLTWKDFHSTKGDDATSQSMQIYFKP